MRSVSAAHGPQRTDPRVGVVSVVLSETVEIDAAVGIGGGMIGEGSEST
jgi:hypothetical protein